MFKILFTPPLSAAPRGLGGDCGAPAAGHLEQTRWYKILKQKAGKNNVGDVVFRFWNFPMPLLHRVKNVKAVDRF